MVVIGHQVLYPRSEGVGLVDGEQLRGETVKRYWIHRVFHKDSMKIARDFITGEMSVNKNE